MITNKKTIFIIFIFSILIFQLTAQDFYRIVNKQDSTFLTNNSYLLNEIPDKENAERYFRTAHTLWKFHKNKEAKGMLLKVMESDKKVINKTHHHSSDIPGDTTTNIYGYGSFTSNYKNKASILLCKIYIEEQKFERAFHFFEKARDKYVVTYTCGTGYHQYNNELTYLHVLCLEGLGKIDEAIDVFLPECFSWRANILIRILRKKYNEKVLKDKVLQSLETIEFIVNEYESEIETISNSGSANEKKEIHSYTSGKGTIQLFGKTINLPAPLNLKAGETVTKKHFIEEFKSSSFYKQTTNDYSY